ncbi:3-isopropylmalate dehydrogenase [Geodia barretti]|uniref:isocitrate dehydrogenase (NAD(+)) n=1 Tax=Geodia barretti TaxID=519541 RepID=A0AA35SF82_GEOBA|nr:3-isopropylmalate dehydrogenase [Geodia barretti]
MRKALDLFANVRPVRIPSENIDWTFFRENTEDLYAVGRLERIIEPAFDHAERTGKTLVTIVTKANVVKTTDGKFLDVARRIGEKYPDIEWDGWYIDIMTAKLIDPKRRSDFQRPADTGLHTALDICGMYEKKVVMTGRDTRSRASEFGDYL